MGNPLIIRPAAIDFVAIIAPGRPYNVEMPGTFFRIVSANAAFQIKIDSQASATVRGGDIYHCPGDTFFQRLTILNASATDTLAVTITVGQGDFAGSATATLAWPTKLVGSATVSIADGGNLDLPGTPAGQLVQRAQFQVSNNDPSASLQIRDQDGNIALTVFAQTSIALPLSGFVRIHNDTAGAISVAVSELWYFNP